MWSYVKSEDLLLYLNVDRSTLINLTLKNSFASCLLFVTTCNCSCLVQLERTYHTTCNCSCLVQLERTYHTTCNCSCLFQLERTYHTTCNCSCLFQLERTYHTTWTVDIYLVCWNATLLAVFRILSTQQIKIKTSFQMAICMFQIFIKMAYTFISTVLGWSSLNLTEYHIYSN